MMDDEWRELMAEFRARPDLYSLDRPKEAPPARREEPARRRMPRAPFNPLGLLYGVFCGPGVYGFFSGMDPELTDVAAADPWDPDARID